MRIEDQILINKFGQDLLTFQQVLAYFRTLNQDNKKKFLTDLSYLILQSKPLDSDIDKAIDLGKLKSTYTPIVKIKKGIKSDTLLEIIALPENETEKSLILFLSIYRIAYKRVLEKEKENPDKWWYQDLSDDNFVERIKSLSDLKLVIKKLYDIKGKEIGSIIIAFIPFPINLYEKNVIERQLELYAFNYLYPYEGINIFKEIHDDMASVIVIKDINALPHDEKKISIY